MPKHKSKKKEDSSDSSDSGPDDRLPQKKAKTETKSKETKSKETKSKESKSSNEEDNSWPLAKNRHVKLTEFKGKWYIDIREFYHDSDGDLRPSKKGIMLTMEQWQKFKGCVEEIDEAVKKNV